PAETDVVGRGLRAQMKYADKIGAQFSMVLGDNEIAEGKAKVKNMETGEQTELALDERFAEQFSDLYLSDFTSLDGASELSGLNEFLKGFQIKE
ncbi:MAG: hypothetical protein II127_03655, partial [Ruminococcus sp.]|nr:hypothetical protein [Ruminococcus sp.]